MDERRQRGFDEFGLHSYHGEEYLQIGWRSKPTIEQERYIEEENLEANQLN
jgi:hypothetical protein